MRISQDLSILWFNTCDLIRAEFGALASGAGCFLYPSLESAMLDLTWQLIDREKELSGARNRVLFGRGQDPAFEVLAQLVSAQGFVSVGKDDSEWSAIGSWFDQEKSKCLLVAVAAEDRFNGGHRDIGAVKDRVLASGNKVPLMTVAFSDRHRNEMVVPASYEIVLHEISNGAVLALCGERLKLQPRLAPYLMTPAQLLMAAQILTSSSPVFPRDKARALIEGFEEKLPQPFSALWPKGSRRVLDRAVIQSSALDGSWVIDELKKKLVNEAPAEVIEGQLETLSGCATQFAAEVRPADERRQEWLRARGGDAWLIRGTVHIGLDLLQTVGAPKLLRMLGELPR